MHLCPNHNGSEQSAFHEELIAVTMWFRCDEHGGDEHGGDEHGEQQ